MAVAQPRSHAGVAQASGHPGGNSERFQRHQGKKITRPGHGCDATSSSIGPAWPVGLPGIPHLENWGQPYPQLTAQGDTRHSWRNGAGHLSGTGDRAPSPIAKGSRVEQGGGKASGGRIFLPQCNGRNFCSRRGAQ